ncbi:hypothetical protein KSP40_PGU022309 [Platanthera guangdongensis]|uniref:Uncharacterized protein n=1 Tax=Platanthera guangdongensis TaxID=2320717 RepID=A0ABR2M5J2_9ASPA
MRYNLRRLHRRKLPWIPSSSSSSSIKTPVNKVVPAPPKLSEIFRGKKYNEVSRARFESSKHPLAKMQVWSSHLPPPIPTLRFHAPDPSATAEPNEA